jgi:N-acetylglucosaminyldiphosphoundecaprenol N-acetyl-beta-D-mannosaminyltransferase
MPGEYSPKSLFSNQNMISTTQDLLAWLSEDSQQTQTTWYLNPYTLALAENGALPLKANDNFVADGNTMAQVLSHLTGHACESLNFDFTGCANEVFKLAERNAMPLAIIGGTEIDLEKFLVSLAKRYPQLKVVFTHNGYFDLNDVEELIARLKAASPKLTLISMGSPRQEVFSAMVRRTDGVRTKMITSGAFISQVAERGLNYYPRWIVRYRLRWAYRMVRSRRVLVRVLRFYIPFWVRWRLFRALPPILSSARFGGRDAH